MTFSEALKSGKSFRRPYWANGLAIEVVDGLLFYAGDRGPVHLTVDSYLATDWILEPEVYEGDLFWCADSEGRVFPAGSDIRPFFKKLVGKKTKFRLEVISD